MLPGILEAANWKNLSSVALLGNQLAAASAWLASILQVKLSSLSGFTYSALSIFFWLFGCGASSQQPPDSNRWLVHFVRKNAILTDSNQICRLQVQFLFRFDRLLLGQVVFDLTIGNYCRNFRFLGEN